VLARHGFGYLVDELGLSRLVPFHWGLFGHARKPTPYTQPEHLRLALQELGVGFIKLGQMLSTRPDLLAPTFVGELSKLRDAVPPAPSEAVTGQIRRELGEPPSEFFADFEPHPLGSASIGEVHGARLKTGEEVVVKIQRPGVEEQAEMGLTLDCGEGAKKPPPDGTHLSRSARRQRRSPACDVLFGP
jgi:ubiquinone biosynthesis protein